MNEILNYLGTEMIAEECDLLEERLTTSVTFETGRFRRNTLKGIPIDETSAYVDRYSRVITLIP